MGKSSPKLPLHSVLSKSRKEPFVIPGALEKHRFEKF